MSRRDENPDCKLYIGGLEKDTSEQELEDAFAQYGKIESVWVSRDRPGFGFVTFQSPDEADEAMRNLNGQSVAGCTLRVEVAGAKRGGSRGGRGGGGGFRGGFGGRGGGGGGGFRGGRGGGYGGGSRGGGGCFNCGDSGHFARDCPQGGSGQGRGRSSYGRGGYRRSDDRNRSRSPSFR